MRHKWAKVRERRVARSLCAHTRGEASFHSFLHFLQSTSPLAAKNDQAKDHALIKLVCSAPPRSSSSTPHHLLPAHTCCTGGFLDFLMDALLHGRRLARPNARLSTAPNSTPATHVPRRAALIRKACISSSHRKHVAYVVCDTPRTLRHMCVCACMHDGPRLLYVQPTPTAAGQIPSPPRLLPTYTVPALPVCPPLLPPIHDRQQHNTYHNFAARMIREQ